MRVKHLRSPSSLARGPEETVAIAACLELRPTKARVTRKRGEQRSIFRRSGREASRRRKRKARQKLSAAAARSRRSDPSPLSSPLARASSIEHAAPVRRVCKGEEAEESAWAEERRLESRELESPFELLPPRIDRFSWHTRPSSVPRSALRFSSPYLEMARGLCSIIACTEKKHGELVNRTLSGAQREHLLLGARSLASIFRILAQLFFPFQLSKTNNRWLTKTPSSSPPSRSTRATRTSSPTR